MASKILGEFRVEFGGSTGQKFVVYLVGSLKLVAMVSKLVVVGSKIGHRFLLLKVLWKDSLVGMFSIVGSIIVGSVSSKVDVRVLKFGVNRRLNACKIFWDISIKVKNHERLF